MKELIKKLNRPLNGREKGVALLVVMVTITLIASLSISIRTESSVSAQIAMQSRNRLQARYLAKFATKLASVMVVEQRKIESQLDKLKSSGIKIPANFKIWDLIKLDSETIRLLKEGGSEALEMIGLSGIAIPDVKGLNDLPGRFWFDIEVEEGKLNLNALAKSYTTTEHQFVATSLLRVLNQSPYNKLLERPYYDGQVYKAEDLVSALRDWIDWDDQVDEITPQPRGNFALKPRGGSEDTRYSMLEKPYKNKNNVFYSANELYFISGFSEEIIDKLKKNLTVYNTAGISISDASITVIVDILKASSKRAEDIDEMLRRKDPNFLNCLLTYKKQRSQMDPKKFTAHFKSCGIVFNSEKNLQKLLGAKPNFYRLSGYGEMGDVQVKIETVITFDDKGLMKKVYWNENPM